ncbi:hypothetical protein T03_4537 [Trichinella britovi]|uniref:Uncharacterized protein n=1 Tax=Trichinella britovi TaxID=45882 RepID=A0A0V1CEZ5_TRIBR|nr:hypothetical protein T03_4537 [Trichinella britovi]
MGAILPYKTARPDHPDVHLLGVGCSAILDPRSQRSVVTIRCIVTSVLGRDSCSRMYCSIPQSRRTLPGISSYRDCLARRPDGTG